MKSERGKMPAVKSVQFHATSGDTSGANERCWAMLPVAPVLHAGEKFLAFTTEGIYTFGSPPSTDPDHPGKQAFFFDDEFSSPPLREIKNCFRLTGEIRVADLQKCTLESGWSTPVLALETAETSRRFALPRDARKTAVQVVKVLNGENGKEIHSFSRPAGIVLLFTVLLCVFAPGVNLFISLLLITAGCGLLLSAFISSPDHNDTITEKP